MDRMIARAGQQGRLNFAAVALFALLAFTSFAAGRLTATPQQVFVVPSTPVVSRTVEQRPIQAPIDSCASGAAYVTGDMVGDASPADVYARLCPSR
jgi:hypothetical protein